jgi:hypothetical protein
VLYITLPHGNSHIYPHISLASYPQLWIKSPQG